MTRAQLKFVKLERFPPPRILPRLRRCDRAFENKHDALEVVMATTMCCDETIHDQGGRTEVDVEPGRSTFYSEDSIYLIVDGKTVIMDRPTAKRFVEAVVSVAQYH
jgi:hypothetical protein